MDALSLVQMDEFLTNGFLVMNDFISVETCVTLKKRMAHLLETNKTSIPSVAFSSDNNSHAKSDYFLNSADKIHFFLEPGATDEKGNLRFPLEQSINKVGHGLHHCDEIFKAFSHDPRIKTFCQQLGFKSVGLLQSMYIYKQPTIGDAVNWHQDSTYLHMEGSDVIGFWFALEDATIENGCLQVIPSPDVTPLKERLLAGDGESELIKLSHKPWAKEQRQFVEVKQGSLVMLHGRVPHASGPNHSAKSRQAFALHLVDHSKHYSKENWLQWPDNQVPVFKL